jgi:hypothetical protein
MTTEPPPDMIVPTVKDFKFYSEIYHNSLQQQEKDIQRMIRFLEKEMERHVAFDHIRESNALQMEKYLMMLHTNKTKRESLCDDSNDNFMRFMQSHLQAKEKQKINQQRKKDAILLKKTNERNILQKYYKTESGINYQQRRLKRDMDMAWERLNQIDRDMPVHMKRALQQMPNNKGYIYRGVSYYGYLPSENKTTTTLFERVKGIMYIHEYTYFRDGKEFRLYEKLSKNTPKTLVRFDSFNNK